MGFFTHKLTLELKEIRHRHQLELEAERARFTREKSNWDEDRARLEKQLKEDYEIKLCEAVSLAKLNSEQHIKQAELNAERKINKAVEDLNKSYYEKLSDSMKKLHEEGNVTTKYLQETTIALLNNSPKNKSETKVITGKSE